MKIKRIACIALVLLLIANAMPGLAHLTPKHNEYLEQVLFGSYGVPKSDKAQKALYALEYAVYLAIDQYRGEGQEALDYLKEYRVWGIPREISEFDLRGIYYGDHRSYTHLGWDHTYEKDMAKWEMRKNILLATTEKVFSFRFLPSWIVGYDDRCESFAALMYYVHIIADHEEGANSEKYLIPLADPDLHKTDIFDELGKHLGILFDNSRHSHTYPFLKADLTKLRDEARSAKAKGDFDAEHYVKELLKLLKEHIPELLRDEPFFMKAFY